MAHAAASFLFRAGHALTDALLPQTCAGCDTPMPGRSGALCPACRARLEHLATTPSCPRCARTMRREAIHEHRCAACDTERHWNISGAVRIGPYVPPLMTLLRGLKFRGEERNAKILAELLAARLREEAWFGEIDAFVPVPMHWLRRLQRPCAHAHVLAEALRREVRRTDGRLIPVLRATRRVRYAPSQLDITVRARRFENVAGCFAAVRESPPTWLSRWQGADVAGHTVCIVDNLLVTGATIHEVSKALRRAGASAIYLAVIARTVTAGDFQADPAAFEDDGTARV